MNWNSIKFDWNHARAFLVVAEEGSLTAGAKALNTTQPTLSRQISALEQELSVTLFERVGRGLELTESGQRLKEAVQTMGEAANNFSILASGQSNDLGGKVIISASEVDAIYRLPDIISKIQNSAPELIIEIQVSNDVADLKHRQADIAIRSFRPEQPDLIAKKIGTYPIGLYASKKTVSDLPGGKQQPRLQQCKFIGFEALGRQIQFLNDKGWPVTQENFPVITSNQILQIALARLSSGIIFLPCDIGSAMTDLEKIKTKEGHVMLLDMWLVSHRELRTNPAVKFVFDQLADALPNTLQ